MTPPIRFLAVVVGGWTAARIIALLPAEQPSLPLDPPAGVNVPDRLAPGARVAATPVAAPPGHPRFMRASARELGSLAGSGDTLGRPFAYVSVSTGDFEVPAKVIKGVVLPQAKLAAAFAGTGAMPDLALTAPPSREDRVLYAAIVSPPQGENRLTGSAWMLARGDDVAAVATNGLLGGSQAGARLLYRVGGSAAQPLSFSARLSGPLRRAGAEAALGIEWQPMRGVPLRLLAERRQRLNGDGRSAFAAIAHGGVSDLPVAQGLRLEAYAQAGIVGARNRDLFADGAITLVRPLSKSRFAVGAGLWGGAQPGSSRLDVGPRLTTTLPAASRHVRVSLDWRLRVAGLAAPSSGAVADGRDRLLAGFRPRS